MCRWLAYSGGPVFLDDLLFKPKNNLIDQSMSSRSAETPTNGDGVGVGWYGKRERPGLYRSVRPAWNDFNLHDLAANIESHLFLAHVRATSLATIQETNCHPFRYGKWLFLHNGEIFEIEKFRRDLLMAIDAKYFSNILGTTDSEVIFHLALTFGLEKDPVTALKRTAGFIEETGKKHGVDESLWATLAATDGNTIWCVRYASDRGAPTLYVSRSADEIYAINPELTGHFGDAARVVVSEPPGKFAEMWQEVPQSSMIVVKDGSAEITPFEPMR